jgi:AcrR family transcriptional regulator
MPRPPKHQTENTRARALDAADALLHEHGYLGASMDAIADQVGIRKASLYHHFPDGKDQIMLEIGEHWVDKFKNGFQNAFQAGSTVRERLEAIAAFVFQDTRQTNRVLQNTIPYLPAQHQQTLGTGFYLHIFGTTQNVFETGITTKELRPHDTRFSAFAFLSLLSEMGAPEHQKTWLDLPSRVTSILLDGLEADTPKEKP